MENKAILGIMLTLVLFGTLISISNIQLVKAVTIIVPDENPTIQEAINNANEGDTVFVKAGTYYENVVVNKTLSLIGENKRLTIIDANGTDVALRIYAEGVSVSGFTIRNSLKPGYGFGDGIRLHSSRNTIRENIIEDNFRGVYVEANYNNISNNEVRGNFDGIRLEFSRDNAVDDNNITLSKNNGLILSGSDKNMVSGNRLQSNHLMGIILISSNENRIVGNMISNSGSGIWLDDSWDNTLRGNTVLSSDKGLLLRLSGGNTLRNNNLMGNVYNFAVFQYFEYNLSHFMNDIDPSNTVDGKPIYYLVNQHNMRVPEDAGYVAIVNSTNIIASNLNLTRNWQGILLASARNSVVSGLSVSRNYDGLSMFFSNDVLIANNTVMRNWDGMIIWQSDGNTIAGNDVTWHDGEGISLWNCSGNTVEKNTVLLAGKFGIRLLYASNNLVGLNNVSECSHDYPGWGVNLYSSDNNIIFGNNLVENGAPSWGNSGGIDLEYSDDNVISHNNFLGNRRQAFSYNSENAWDGGYPSGGNYWSDYDERYPNATELDDSGIWDTPYVIDENNLDNYPLTEPWTPAPSLPTTIQELKTKIEEFWSQGKIDNQGIVRNLVAKLSAAQKLVDDGKIDRAKTVLEVFIPQIQNLSRMHISFEAAEILIKSAEHIILHL